MCWFCPLVSGEVHSKQGPAPGVLVCVFDSSRSWGRLQVCAIHGWHWVLPVQLPGWQHPGAEVACANISVSRRAVWKCVLLCGNLRFISVLCPCPRVLPLGDSVSQGWLPSWPCLSRPWCAGHSHPAELFLLGLSTLLGFNSSLQSLEIPLHQAAECQRRGVQV